MVFNNIYHMIYVLSQNYFEIFKKNTQFSGVFALNTKKMLIMSIEQYPNY